jgi:hypothetical protein
LNTDYDRIFDADYREPAVKRQKAKGKTFALNGFAYSTPSAHLADTRCRGLDSTLSEALNAQIFFSRFISQFLEKKLEN